MNSLIGTATTYLRQLATTLNSPRVRSELQAVLQSPEAKTLIGTLRDRARGVSAAPTPGSPTTPSTSPLAVEGQPQPDEPAPAPAMSGRARRRARAKQHPRQS